MSSIDSFKQETLSADTTQIKSYLDKQTVDLMQLQAQLHSQVSHATLSSRVDVLSEMMMP